MFLKAPNDLNNWRNVEGDVYERKLWNALDPIFQRRGVYLWPSPFDNFQKIPTLPKVSAYAYVTELREKGIGSAHDLRHFQATVCNF